MGGAVNLSKHLSRVKASILRENIYTPMCKPLCHEHALCGVRAGGIFCEQAECVSRVSRQIHLARIVRYGCEETKITRNNNKNHTQH